MEMVLLRPIASMLNLRPNSGTRSAYLKYSGMAFHMMASILIGLFIGRWIDNQLKFIAPLGVVAGVLLGLTAAFMALFKAIKS